MGAYVESFSIGADEEYRIKTYLKQLQSKGVSKSKWIVNAIIRQIEFEEEQARKQQIQKSEVVVGGALAACAVGNGKPNKRQLTEEEIDEQRLLAMRSRKYQLEAHQRYHDPELREMYDLPRSWEKEELIGEYIRMKGKNCYRCREIASFYTGKRNNPHQRVHHPSIRISEREKRKIYEKRKHLHEKYGDAIEFVAEEEEQEQEIPQTLSAAEVLPPPSPSPSSPSPQQNSEKM
jgi:hypothetical protein